MSKRNALRIGPDPHEINSVEYAVDRYGEIEKETLDEIVSWLKEQGDAYVWKVGTECATAVDGSVLRRCWPFIRTQRKGSVLYKILDNEHDAQNTLANIRNKDFPRNRQGN